MDDIEEKYTIKDLQEIFNEYTNESGTLDESCLQVLIKEILGKYILQNQILSLIKKINNNKKSEIDFDEFIKLIKNLKEYMELDEDYLKEVFKIFDRENKGYLSPQGVYHTFLALGETIKFEDIIDVLKEYDFNGDGNLSFEEFKLLMNKGLEDLEKIKPKSIILNLDDYFNLYLGYNKKKQS